MREKEEGKFSNLRRSGEEDYLVEDREDPSVYEGQSVETLREGYSWTRALESRYPGWHPPTAEGFPFILPTAELADSRVCLVTLAGVYVKGQKPFNTSPGVVSHKLRSMRFRDPGDPSCRQISRDADPSELEIAHAHYDHSEADEDINCVFPLFRLRELEMEGLIGEAVDFHYSLMGFSPDPHPLLATVQEEIIPSLREQDVDVAIVGGGCELSHVCGALVQREIESSGIATVGVSVCPDITYQMQVPRAVSVRFPLGNPFGASMDQSMQARILRDALMLIPEVKTPGELVSLPYEWLGI